MEFETIGVGEFFKCVEGGAEEWGPNTGSAFIDVSSKWNLNTREISHTKSKS